jgi:hypothetical protein
MFEYMREKFEYTDKGQLSGVTFQLTELGKDLVYKEHELTSDSYNEKDYHSIEKVWDEMFEYFQGHGWDYIPMWIYESLGYLTENPYVITDNCHDVFYFDSYQVKSVMYDIVCNGKVFFQAMQYSSEELQSVFEIIENGW